MGVVGHGTDRDNRMGPVSGLVDNLNLFFPGRKDKSTAPIALVRKGEEGVCSGGWNCLSQGQQVGILFSAILFSVSLILAMAYYCHNRKNQGWTDDDENIIPMRPIQRKRSDDKMRRSRSIVSRHTSYSLPTIPGVQPPQYNAIVPLRQPTVYSYIQGQNPILLPAPPIHALQPALGPVQSNQGTAVRAMQGQPNYRPIQLQVGLPMPRQTWYEAQYHECGKSPGYTSLAQRFLQLCRMPYGRAETISSSRPQSRSNLTERRQSQESRFSAVSAEAAPEGHRNEGRPTDDCAVTASPQSHIATVYSDDFLLPHHPEQAGESTRSDADARDPPGTEAGKAWPRGVQPGGNLGRFRDNSSPDLTERRPWLGRQRSSGSDIQHRRSNGHETRQRHSNPKHKRASGNGMIRMLITALSGAMEDMSTSGKEWNDGDAEVEMKVTRRERESWRRTQETRYCVAMAHDDSTDSGTGKETGPIPPQPLHQGGGQYGSRR